MFDLAILIGGVVLAFFGGELFLRGVVNLSAWLRVPKAVMAVSLAAFATSSPEISVAVNAALAHRSTIALGDALGSNIVNVGLVLGLVLVIGPLKVEWREVGRDYAVALAVPCILLGLLADGVYSRTDAVLALLLFCGWLTFVIRAALRDRSERTDAVTSAEGIRAALIGSAGLGLLVLAGKLIVMGATGIGAALGLSEFVIGATIVALGTSTPELATAVISKLRGHDEVGVGTILGSNIFNCLFITGIAAIISPFPESLTTAGPSLVFGILTVLVIYPRRAGLLGRSRGVALLVLYASAVALTMTLGSSH